MLSMKDSEKSGATIKFDARGFEQVEVLLSATGGLSLSQVCAISGIEPTTIQNWVKRGWVEHPDGKRYGETHIARILIINSLKECIKLEQISLLMDYIRGKQKNPKAPEIVKESEVFTCLCRALSEIGNVNAMARGGVETVAERAVSTLRGIPLAVKNRVKKALTIMIYACVCTDVKRRTESMLEQVFNEKEVAPDDIPSETDNVQGKQSAQAEMAKKAKQPVQPKNAAQQKKAEQLIQADESIQEEESTQEEDSIQPEETIQPEQAPADTAEQEPEAVVVRKTISQALRELEMNLAGDKRRNAHINVADDESGEIFPESEPEIPQEEPDNTDFAKTEPPVIKPMYFKRN